MIRGPLRELYGAFLAPSVADALASGHDPRDLRHGVEVLRDRLSLLDSTLAEVLVVDLGVAPARLVALSVIAPSWDVATTPAALLTFSAGVARRPEWLISAGVAATGLGIAAGLG